MTAPGGVEFNQNVLGVVLDDFVEVLTDKDLDGFIIGGGDIFRLQVSLELTSDVVINERVNGSNGDFATGELVLEDFVAGVNEHQSGSLSSVGTNVVSESLVVTETIIRLGDREDELTLVFTGSLSESSFSSVGLIVTVSEEEQSGVTLLEDLLDGSVVEGHNERERVRIDESLQGSLGEFTSEVVSEFIELLVEDNVGVGSVLGGSQFSVENVSEGEIVVRHGQRLEGRPFSIRFTSTVVNDGDLILLGEGKEFFSSADSFRNGTSSLLDPVNDFLISSTTVEIDGVFEGTSEELQGGETLDTESTGEFLLFGGINLSEDGSRVFTSQSGGSLSVFRGELLAVTTPGGVEFNQNEGLGGNEVIEVRVS